MRDWECFEPLRMMLPFTLTQPTFSFQQTDAQKNRKLNETIKYFRYLGLLKTPPHSSVAFFVQKQANHGRQAVMYYVFTDTFSYLIGGISGLRFRQLRECPEALALFPNRQIWGMSYYSWEWKKRTKGSLVFFYPSSLGYKIENICVTKYWDNVCMSLAQS